MSVRIEYVCNTCNDKKDKEKIYAVIFNAGGNNFSLWPWNTQNFMDHKGVHVCENCLQSYRKI